MRLVAIFFTGSSTVDRPSVDSGLVPPSATPAAPEVAVPSTVYRIVFVWVWPEASRFRIVSRWNIVSTAPGIVCGVCRRPPPVPVPGAPVPSSRVPFISSGIAPVLNCGNAPCSPSCACSDLYWLDWTKTSPGERGITTLPIPFCNATPPLASSPSFSPYLRAWSSSSIRSSSSRLRSLRSLIAFRWPVTVSFSSGVGSRFSSLARSRTLLAATPASLIRFSTPFSSRTLGLIVVILLG